MLPKANRCLHRAKSKTLFWIGLVALVICLGFYFELLISMKGRLVAKTIGKQGYLVSIDELDINRQHNIAIAEGEQRKSYLTEEKKSDLISIETITVTLAKDSANGKDQGKKALLTVTEWKKFKAAIGTTTTRSTAWQTSKLSSGFTTNSISIASGSSHDHTATTVGSTTVTKRGKIIMQERTRDKGLKKTTVVDNDNISSSNVKHINGEVKSTDNGNKLPMDKSPEKKVKSDLSSSSHSQNVSEWTACPHYELNSRHDVKNASSNVKCRSRPSSLASCKYAAKEYAPKIHLKDGCQVNKDQIEICRELSSYTLRSLRFACSHSVCSHGNRSLIGVSVTDISTSDLRTVDIYHSSRSLEADLPNIVESSSSDGYNYVFLECLDHNERSSNQSQLLLFPHLMSAQEKNSDKVPHVGRYKFDISLVMIDSVSRSHFFRSLPMTIDAIRRINKDTESDAEILDFEMFQSVHGHSAENLHALFNGKLFPKTMTEEEKEAPACDIKTLFGHVKKEGYRTLYQEDLCWKGGWGMRIDIGGNSANWEDLKKSIDDSEIDSTGMTFSSCKLLADNGLETPFNGPDTHQLCHNGKFLHEYILEYVYGFHGNPSRDSPLVSYSATNVGHDPYGLRIQTFDRNLASFFGQITRPDYNTLTILFADHGNTYTEYTDAYIDGSFEMYHPALFVVVPAGVKKQLGHDVMNALRVNRKRLFTLIDVHHTVKYLTSASVRSQGDKTEVRGLARELSKDRTCDNIELAYPNYCQCEGWDMARANDTQQIGIVEFAVGKLNNKLMTARLKAERNGSTPTMRCHPIEAVSFDNVRERASSTQSGLVTTLDIHMRSGLNSGQQQDTFRVNVQSVVDISNPSRDFKLVSYDRISRFGVYRACADHNVNVRLCVCDIIEIAPNTSVDSQLAYHNFLNGSVFNSFLLFDGFRHVMKTWYGCLSVIKTSYPDVSEQDSVHASSLSAVNMCSNRTFVLSMFIETKNMKFSSLTTFKEAAVLANSVVYIGTLVRDIRYWPSSAELKFTIKEHHRT